MSFRQESVLEVLLQTSLRMLQHKDRIEFSNMTETRMANRVVRIVNDKCLQHYDGGQLTEVQLGAY
jgi:hypothetical protein